MSNFEVIRNRIDDKLYEGRSSEYDFRKDVESAFGSEFNWLSPEAKSKIHYMAYDKGHSSGLREVLNQYFDLIELTSCMLKTINFKS